MKDIGEILTLEEVAAHLKSSVKTVRRRIQSRKLPAFREGGRVCVLLRDLEAYIEQQIQTTSTQ